MRIVFGRLLLILTLCSVAACGAWAEAYRILRFDVNLKLSEDRVVSVEERMTVSFLEPRHGIYRKIPIHYDTGKGVARTMQISNISVTDEDGNGYKTKVSTQGDSLVIRVGDPKILMDTGIATTYVFRYDARNVLNWFDESNDWQPSVECYWNATGTENEPSIEASKVTMTFPKVAKPSDVRAIIFAGPYGSKNAQQVTGGANSAVSAVTKTRTTLTENSLTIERTEPLAPFEGISLDVSLPESLIAKPSFLESAMIFLMPNLGFLLPIFILSFMGLVWLKYGKDPAAGPVAVRFEIPDNLDAAECGVLIDEKVDLRDFSAAMVSLAVKGYLTFEVTDRGWPLGRNVDLARTNKPEGADLSAFEKRYLEVLGANFGEVLTSKDLRYSVGPQAQTLIGELYGAMVKKGFYSMDPQSARVAWGLVLVMVTIVLGAIATFLSPVREPLPAVIGGILSIVLGMPLVMLMPRRTRQGLEAFRQVRGFEEFLRRARRDDLSWTSKVRPTQALFEEYLPFAVAFGVVDEWTHAFGDVLKEPPGWYHGPYDNMMWQSIFIGDMNRMTQTMAAASMTPPRSDGASGGGSGFSSGGGFSGGGFGGGGSGSW